MDLDRWYWDSVDARRPPPSRLPMYTRLATGKPCQLPWSAVVGALTPRPTLEGFWPRTMATLVEAMSRG